jgi:hypothetical protein
MNLIRCLLSLAVVGVASGLVLAQPPSPKPGPEHDLLKKLEGTWEATVHAGGQDSKGTMVYKSTCGGLWLASKYEGDFGGQKFEGRGLDGYNSFKKKYVSVWVDSMSPSPLITEGTFDDASKTMTMTGEGAGPDGSPQKWKIVNKWSDDDTVQMKMYTVQDGKDNEMMTIDYKRKK